MEFDITAFLDEGRQLNLLLPKLNDPRHNQVFRFDTNLTSGIIVPARVSMLRQVIELARKHSSDAPFGEHTALLGQIAKREEIENPFVQWHRHYYTNFSSERNAWITLEEWLEEGGRLYL